MELKSKKNILKIKRIYHPWHKWECYKNGFYEKQPPKGYTINSAKEAYSEFFMNSELFEEYIQKVFYEWKYSCEHFLTNPDINRIAWIGQSSMCRYSGISSFFRSGFYLMPKKNQYEADNMALKWLNQWIIKKNEQFKKKYIPLYKWLED